MDNLTDPYLGELILESEYSNWKGSVRVSNRRSVRVTIDVDVDSPPTAIQDVSELIRNVIEGEARYRNAVADEPLENYNGNWRQGRLFHPRFLFKLRIHLTSVWICGVGTKYEYKMIHFSDGGLFYGHVFELYEKHEGLKKVALAG